MSTNYRPGTKRAADAMDAMWDAMEQIRSEFDKRVAPRMGRGDVRTAILALLHEQPMHGYQVIREIEERTGGTWKPSAGSVYPTLQLLADEGLVSVETSEDRKIYSLTEEGRVDAAAAAASAPWNTEAKPEDKTGHRDGPVGAVSRAGFELAQVVAHVARTGTPEQQKSAAAELEATRRRIYSILAQD
ncbi:PadR family transcriptional regulator [Demequina pelophila]|uniref:PadR family transcriptional regulator n=1 Tax=Demequina pelophila TaxID=1638984 RepID=UPI000783D3E0|nr:PadR family transcriptional regulator [Demequina pelophila]